MKKFELTGEFITNIFGKKLFRIRAQVSGDADILQITGLGTVHRTTTVFRTPDGIRIACGCFYGDLDAFREQVKETREGKVQREYLKFTDLVEIYFGEDKEDECECS